MFTLHYTSGDTWALCGWYIHKDGVQWSPFLYHSVWDAIDEVRKECPKEADRLELEERYVG